MYKSELGLTWFFSLFYVYFEVFLFVESEIRRCRNLGDPISFDFCSCCKYDIERVRIELHLSASVISFGKETSLLIISSKNVECSFWVGSNGNLYITSDADRCC